MEGSTFHTVRGQKRHGLLYDPGASSGIIGTDTLLDYVREVLGGADIHTLPSFNKFTGIDGEPTPGVGKAVVPLMIPALRDSTFTADMIGGSGSYCPGLLPLSTSIRLKASMFAGVFPNLDGVLGVRPVDHSTGELGKVVYLRLLHTDSGHYLIPIDNRDDPGETDQRFLRQAVMKHLAVYLDNQQHEVSTLSDGNTGAETCNATNVNAALPREPRHKSMDPQHSH